MSETATATEAFAPLYVELVRLANYRGIESCEIELEARPTLLVGAGGATTTSIVAGAADPIVRSSVGHANRSRSGTSRRV